MTRPWRMGQRSLLQATYCFLPGYSHGRRKSSWTNHRPPLESDSWDESDLLLPCRDPRSIHKGWKSVVPDRHGNHASASPSVWSQRYPCSVQSSVAYSALEFLPDRSAPDRDLPSASLTLVPLSPAHPISEGGLSTRDRPRSWLSLAPGQIALAERTPDRSASPH